MRASIIIPSYNACERLYNNLISLNMQSCDKAIFEVIVIDDGSTDETATMLLSFKPDFDLKYITLKENKGRAFARNCGLNMATGDLIIFHDSDMIAEKDFVTKHIQRHLNKNSVVCGNSWRRIYTIYYSDFKGYLKTNFYKQLEMYDIQNLADLCRDNKTPLLREEAIRSGKYLDYTFDLYDKSLAEKQVLNQFGSKLEGFNFPWSMFVTNNCSVTKENIESIGGFDSEFVNWGCEDLELGYRLYKKGCIFIKDNDVVSVHQEHPINFRHNGQDNLYYFTNKYNSIDLLLFYYGGEINLSKMKSNEIITEIQEIQKLTNADLVIELYRKLLMMLRDRRNKKRVDKIKLLKDLKSLKNNIVMQKNEILQVLNRLENEVGLKCFAASFRELITKVNNLNLENIHQ